MSPSRRLSLMLVTISAILAIIWLSSLGSSPLQQPKAVQLSAPKAGSVKLDVDPSTLSGAAVMPVLGNATAKAALGRSAWHLLHTMMSRYPEHPTADERSALTSYVHLFTRLYPCGECAEHFRVIVDKFPPQVSSRNAAAGWACHVHNEVNKSLKKEVFDCNKIGDFYDCGCADDDKDVKSGSKPTEEEVRGLSGKPEMSIEAKEKMTGTNGRDFNADLMVPENLLKVDGAR